MRQFFLREWPILLLVAVGIFVFSPLLFFGKAFAGEEQYGFYYALSHYLQESIHAGSSLSWNSAYYGGVPASLDQFVTAWYPLSIVFFSVFGLFFAHHALIVLATTGGLLLSYWFGRLQGWQRVSAVALALGYVSATSFAWLAIGTIAAHSFMMLPGLLVALHYAAVQKRYALAIAGGGLMLGVGFLAGFMQIVFYNFCIAGLYALFLDWSRYRKVVWYRAAPASLTYTAITVVGFLVGFKQFFPSAYYLDQTIRTNTYALQHATFPYPSEFLAFFVPQYFSIPFFGGGDSAGFYVGALGLLAALLGLLYYRTQASVFFAGVYALLLAFAFHLPLFGWLNEHIPPFSHMGGNFRWMVAAAFPIAFLAAAGVEGLLREPDAVSRRAQRVMLACAGVVAAALVLVCAGLALLAQWIKASPQALEQWVVWYTGGRALAYPLEHYTTILSATLNKLANLFSFANPGFLFALLCWAAAGAVLYLHWRRHDPLLSQWLFVSLMTINVAGVFIVQWQGLVPQALYRDEPALATLIKNREPERHAYRVYAYLLGDGLHERLTSKHIFTPAQYTYLQHESMVNNSNLYWGIDRIDGMEPYRTLRHNRLLHTVVAGDSATYAFDPSSPALAMSALDKLYNRDVQKRVSLEEKMQDFGRRLSLLSMMNVKYIYSPYELADPRLAFVASIPLTPAPYATSSLYVYENAAVMPRAYVAEAPVFFSGRDTDLLQRIVATTDFKARTWIECRDCAALPGKGSVTVERYENGSILLRASLSRDSFVVLSESYMDGWQAAVDSVPVPIYRANYLFQAVRVPAGERAVEFSYKEVTPRL